jgi:hypothetical protein
LSHASCTTVIMIDQRNECMNEEKCVIDLIRGDIGGVMGRDGMNSHQRYHCDVPVNWYSYVNKEQKEQNSTSKDMQEWRQSE